ncbi:catalase-like domain-containing protein [Amylocarpus encephaloides]|uniref:Catalase-like domain-containing protein n=1 Tax=Amylocarpus encephaloides TaxID=45428 RepID=A0A9P7YRM7_9HELO|nr:catalase-like domain-containing protein [Amylocarpus encephaloides]
MPFPDDETIMKTAGAIVEQLQGVFGKHPGFRPAHAKGELLSGTFTPSEEAKKLSIAPHFSNPSTPVWVRFSNSTGIPNIPDGDSNADPRGIAVRFNLGPHKHTDIIAHSTPFFPAQNGEQFLGLFQAIAASPPDGPHPTPVELFLGSHPKALAFIQAPKPPPVSYGTEQYWSVSAFKLLAADGKETHIKYHVVPDAGVSTFTADEVKEKDPNYLSTELKERIASGPIGFKILAQIAAEGDITNDATEHWPEDRPVVELGSFTIDAFVPEGDKETKYLIMDPIPRIEGVEPSADPLLEMRAAVYLISGKQRRAA